MNSIEFYDTIMTNKNLMDEIMSFVIVLGALKTTKNTFSSLRVR